MASENEKYETLADIVAEMRRGTKLPGYWRSCDLNEILKYHADRIEAALKREREELREAATEKMLEGATIIDNRGHGNAAALREALEATMRFLDSLEYEEIEPYSPLDEDAPELRKKIRDALAEPARQCDVGTAAEQTKRFSDFCAAHRHTDLPRCAGCPLENTPSDTGCSFAWAQAPYAAKEGAGK